MALGLCPHSALIFFSLNSNDGSICTHKLIFFALTEKYLSYMSIAAVAEAIISKSV